MSETKARSAAWVCVDCFYAYHYGPAAVESPDHRWNPDKFRESMAKNEYEDWSCVAHEYGESWCEHCDSDSDGTETFSMSFCDTCRNPAGGSRHRLGCYA